MSSFKIDYISSAKFEFQPTNSGKNNFVFFTGDNGSGKSTYLLDIAKSLLRRASKTELNVTFTGMPRKVILYSMAPFSKFDSKAAAGFRLHSETQVERIGTAGGNSKYTLLFQALVEFSRSNLAKSDLFDEIAKITGMPSKFRIRFHIDRARLNRFDRPEAIDDIPWNLIQHLSSISGSFGMSLSPANVSIIRYFDDETDNENLRFYKYADNESTIQALLYMRRRGTIRIVEIEALSGNTWRSVENLSSGQLTLYIGLMVLASSLTDQSVVLIDEPEISLHPTWQKIYCDLLYKIATYHKDCYFFVATHSPILVSSVKKNNSFIYNLGNEIEGLSINSEIGLSIEEIFASYFNTLTPSSFIVKAAILRSIQAYEDQDAEEFQQTQVELKKIRPKIREKETRELISEILKRKLK